MRQIDLIQLNEAGIATSPDIEKAKQRQDKAKKKIEKKSSKVLARDFESRCADAKFYIDNNYSKPMSQSQWRSWQETQQRKIDQMPDDPDEQSEDGKKAKAQRKLDAQIYNAIVINKFGHFIRRGVEFLENGRMTFIPGKNDQIKNGYFMEPYKYKKNSTSGSGGGSKSGTSGTRTRSGKMTETSFKKFQRLGKLTGMQLFDAESKPVELDAATLDALPTYTIQVGSVKMDAASWLSDARKAGII